MTRRTMKKRLGGAMSILNGKFLETIKNWKRWTIMKIILMMILVMNGLLEESFVENFTKKFATGERQSW